MNDSETSFIFHSAQIMSHTGIVSVFSGTSLIPTLLTRTQVVYCWEHYVYTM